MKKFFFVLFFQVTCFSLIASPKIDSLLNVLDNTIRLRSEYSEVKEQRIQSLQEQLNVTNNSEEKYQLNRKLFREYNHYNMEAALLVAHQKYDLSLSIGNPQYVLKSEMNIAEILVKTGMYKEALDILENIDKKLLMKEELGFYYHLFHYIYMLLSDNSLTSTEKARYDKLKSQYKDSMLLVNEVNTLGYYFVLNGKLVEQERYKEALLLMENAYVEYGDQELSVGSLAYELSQDYRLNGNIEKEKEYLLISAISDQRMSIKGYISLRKLASLLYKEGDLKRAYSYIKCSMEDATFCKARFRTLEVSEILPIITAAYDQKVKQEKSTLLKYSVFISLLTFILIACLIYIYKQFIKLSFARKSIANMYEEMKRMNEDLTNLNKQLSESNLIKEAYIGSIFNLCSTYIYKMESYRLHIHRDLKSGKVDQATQTTSIPLVSEELKEFFQNFDAIFLSIYPKFVEDFNALLLENERIIPKSDDILTPEMRVFALIRLGISDSTKIASFLHYSPQTVYNYKLKIRNKLFISKEEFSEAILRIGR